MPQITTACRLRSSWKDGDCFQCKIVETIDDTVVSVCLLSLISGVVEMSYYSKSWRHDQPTSKHGHGLDNSASRPNAFAGLNFYNTHNNRSKSYSGYSQPFLRISIE